MNFTEIAVCTYNCCSLNKNIDAIRELTKRKYDLIALQETFITEEKIGILDYVDENYECIGVPAVYSDKVLAACSGRPEGGMAILWRKTLKFHINKVVTEKNFMVVTIDIASLSIAFVNVYMNSDIWEIETLNKYLETLSLLENVITDTKFDAVFFVGDFNADPLSGRAWQNLSHFINRNHLKCFDVGLLPHDSFTFIGYGNSQSRWLDHIVGTVHNYVRVNKIQILTDVTGSDHLPVELVLHVKDSQINIAGSVVINDDSLHNFINWKAIDSSEYEEINHEVGCKLREFNDHCIFNCVSIGCHNVQHLLHIDYLYDKLTESVEESSSRFKQRFVKKNKFKVIPGWNRSVKLLHQRARCSFLKWVSNGKPLGTNEHEIMIETRRQFKKALKDCKQNEHKEICQSIVEKFQNKNVSQFWKDVRRQKTCLKSTNVINNENENQKIANIFAHKFLLSQSNSRTIEKEEEEFMNIFKEKWLNGRKMHLKMSLVSLKRAIASLNSGVGHDGIHSLFLKNASDDFLIMLSQFYNACFTHCYMPSSILKGTINPIIKDKKGNITEASNYRPVMQSSCLLKIFEIHVMNVLSEKLFFDHRQFGFKNGVSTSDACFVLKETMHEYSKGGRSGILTFIDLSKAFDSVNHFILGHKLLENNIPVDIVYILMHYLRNQLAKVNWKSASSDYYFIETGVRQGGILSPFLFNFYIDAIIRDVSAMEDGCTLGVVKMNIMAYADDIVLLGASLNEMDNLYRRLSSLLLDHKLVINKDKCKCLVFGKKSIRNDVNTISLGEDELELVTTYKYLGHYIEGNLSDVKDIEFRLNKFYASSNSLLRNFLHVDLNTFMFLFNAYCKPVYGINLWNNELTYGKCIFKTFEVAYANILKRMLGVPAYASNHITAELCNQLLLRHHLALYKANYLFGLFNTNVI